MLNSNIPEIILEETKHLPDDLLKEVLNLQESESTHLEYEFENYKHLYPDNQNT